MAVLIVIGVLIALFLIIIFIIKYVLFTRFVRSQFDRCNVLVSGKKGSGKDLLFAYIIRKKHKKHYANIPYDNLTEVVQLTDVSCAPNDYQKIVNNQIKKSPHKFIEGKDIYISDIGIYLPSYMDSKLYNNYPSMPILYALSRQLYGNNIHCNTQNIERGWKALREQADFYIIVRRTWKVFGFLITKMTTYDRYQSAKDDIRPMKKRMINKYSKGNADLYNAQSGDIREGFIIQKAKKLTYDTRYFEKVLLEGDRLTD